MPAEAPYEGVIHRLPIVMLSCKRSREMITRHILADKERV